MEELIKQAFAHVEIIGPHVAEGRYDLIGPNGEIILPNIWAQMIEPDWSVTMHMWPIPEQAPRPMHGMPGPPMGGAFDPHMGARGGHGGGGGGRGGQGRPAGMAAGPPPPPMHGGGGGRPGPPPGAQFGGAGGMPFRPGPPPDRHDRRERHHPGGSPVFVETMPSGRSSRGKKQEIRVPGGVMGWFAGSKPVKKSSGSK